MLFVKNTVEKNNLYFMLQFLFVPNLNILSADWRSLAPISENGIFLALLTLICALWLFLA